MRNLSEVEKNYLVCSLLNVIVAIGMFLMKKWAFGGVCAGCALLFFMMCIGSVLKNKKQRKEHSGKGTGNE